MIEVFFMDEITVNEDFPPEFAIHDHNGGFDCNFHNPNLMHIDQLALEKNVRYKIWWHEFLEKSITSRYPRIDFCLDIREQEHFHFRHFKNYNCHPVVDHDHFICSFNGSAHVSRKLLTSALGRFGWFDPETCSKNFAYSIDILDGHLTDFLDEDLHRIYRKFFLDHHSQSFFEKTYSFGHVRYDHENNIYNLEDKITRSFLHIVSESLATSYYPYVSEKFLYSVVTRGLFLAYAQPGWHDHLEQFYGFKKYSRLFDYRFDTIQNPVLRLIELMSMLAKFSVLSLDDWRDLYELEIDVIEYNYDHYFSGNYIKHLETLC